MKRNWTLFFLLVLSVIMLLSLAGCGALFNGDKQLTADKLTMNNTGKKLELDTIYYLDYKSISSNEMYPVFSANSNISNLYLITLNKIGNNLYYKSSKSISATYADKGYSYMDADTYGYLSDAFMLGTKDYTFDSYYADISKPLLRDEIIVISADDRQSWNNAKDKVFSSSPTSCGIIYSYKPSGVTYMPSGSSTPYKYLWVKLNDSLWVCMGDISSYL